MTAAKPDLELREKVALAMGWIPYPSGWYPPGGAVAIWNLPAFEVDRWPEVLGWLTGNGYWWRMDGCGEETWFEVLIPDDRRILWEASGSTPGLAVCRAVAGVKPCPNQ